MKVTVMNLFHTYAFRYSFGCEALLAASVMVWACQSGCSRNPASTAKPPASSSASSAAADSNKEMADILQSLAKQVDIHDLTITVNEARARKMRDDMTRIEDPH